MMNSELHRSPVHITTMTTVYKNSTQNHIMSAEHCSLRLITSNLKERTSSSSQKHPLLEQLFTATRMHQPELSLSISSKILSSLFGMPPRTQYSKCFTSSHPRQAIPQPLPKRRKIKTQACYLATQHDRVVHTSRAVELWENPAAICIAFAITSSNQIPFKNKKKEGSARNQ